MGIESILASIDAEIVTLKQARALIVGATKTEKKSAAVPKSGKRRTLSAEARKRIADAQRKRWAKFYANK